jgi:hypothetical protein
MPADELDEKGCDVGVVADDHHVLIGRALVQEALELRVGCAGREGVGDEDGGLVTGLGADELRGLQAALEWAGDDEIEVDRERAEDVREMDAVALSVLVERAFDVDNGIGAACARTGVAKDEQIHAQPSSCLAGAGSGLVGAWLGS